MFDDLTRENIERYVILEIGRPKWRDARVRVIERGGQRAILKDVSDRGMLFRALFGRRLIAREFRLCRSLGGIEGVPRAYRMLDRNGFLMEYVDAEPALSRQQQGAELGPEFYDRCLRVVEALHERGVLHLDLRNKKNFLIDGAGRAYVIDFASALRLPRWLPLRRVWMRLLGAADRAGVLKMKRRLSPELLSEAERGALRRFELVRTLLFPPILLVKAVRRLVREQRKNRRARNRKGALPVKNRRG